MKKILTLFAVFALGSNVPAHAEFLYDSYFIPGFDGQPNTEFSRWNVLYAPNGGANLPDAFAPNGTYQSASAAGFTPPSDSNPLDPLAFWHADNATITQTNGGHFIIGPGTAGNIYSFSNPGAYELADSTPFTLGTVVFQFQTEGTPVDFSSIRLVYDNGSGLQELAATEYLREYRSGSGAFGGFNNRNALQWDLTGLGISEYQIVWSSNESSMSFQQALVDTAASYEAVVPESRTWTGTGSQNWGQSSNWQEGSPSVTNGNVRFEHASATSIQLDRARTVGEIMIDTAANLTIAGAPTLTSNTGITTTAAATGTYTISSNYQLGAYNLMEIGAGTVRLDGVVSGAYGLLKSGEGTLILGNNNTFGSSTAGIGVQGGTLRIEGNNTFGGSASVLWGRLEVAANANSGSGALGTATTAITVGASSSLFAGITEPAELVIDGNYTIARNINIEQGSFEKRLGAQNATSGAAFTGNIALIGSDLNATDLKLFAQNNDDRVSFSRNLTGGSATSTVSINADGESGTVIFSGNNKTYNSATEVLGGTLIVANGTSTTGNGAWTVADGATLHVDGTLAGTGALELQNGSTLTGGGTINKSLTIGGGVTISPGNSPGTLNTLSQTWSGGGSYLWEINSTAGTQGDDVGWDWLNIDGSLDLDFTELTPFTLQITSLTMANDGGPLSGFDSLTNYSWTIATAADGITGFDASAFLLNTDAFQNAFTGNFEIGQSGNDLVLTYTAIPEPSSLLLILTAIGNLTLRRHRKSPASITL